MGMDRLVDCGPVAVIYADGIARAMMCAPNARLIFFEYREICGERVRCPVVEIVRPVTSFDPAWLRRMMAHSRDCDAVVH